jgi:hypothetical protein
MSAPESTNAKPEHKVDHIAAKEAPPHKREKLIDKAVEDTFPASDPPSYMGGAATGGPKPKKKKSGTSVQAEKPSH